MIDLIPMTLLLFIDMPDVFLELPINKILKISKISDQCQNKYSVHVRKFKCHANLHIYRPGNDRLDILLICIKVKTGHAF